eukprot:TRINITY_DN7579_c0_g1_i1.p4 TRINITY_DN7579_c0_g1~~TRINITY_DN7579_c0_g1_i1.p4  ORF type:complete len:235 (-),score=47.15 TRINITY_DN7579_c0_g1_i1:26-730(-)
MVCVTLPAALDAAARLAFAQPTITGIVLTSEDPAAIAPAAVARALARVAAWAPPLVVHRNAADASPPGSGAGRPAARRDGSVPTVGEVAAAAPGEPPPAGGGGVPRARAAEYVWELGVGGGQGDAWQGGGCGVSARGRARAQKLAQGPDVKWGHRRFFFWGGGVGHVGGGRAPSGGGRAPWSATVVWCVDRPGGVAPGPTPSAAGRPPTARAPPLGPPRPPRPKTHPRLEKKKN